MRDQSYMHAKPDELGGWTICHYTLKNIFTDLMELNVNTENENLSDLSAWIQIR